VNSEWWSETMPSRAFQREGLVHMSVRYENHGFCGVACVPYGVTLLSTDAVREYAALLAVHEHEVNCIECLVEMWNDDLAPG
jgi:hypothetical protein